MISLQVFIKLFVNNSLKHFGNNRKDSYEHVVVDTLLSASLTQVADFDLLGISPVFKL